MSGTKSVMNQNKELIKRLDSDWIVSRSRESMMQSELSLGKRELSHLAISPYLELGAYEAMWSDPKATFPRLAKKFRETAGALPSDFVSEKDARHHAEKVIEVFKNKELTEFGVVVHGSDEYPQKLRDARNPIELLYYQGWLDLVSSRCVAVVGTRKPSPEGLMRARKLARMFVEMDFTVVSGLADGIDTAAHQGAIDSEGKTIAVIGTPISESYPRKNADLQAYIAKNFLLISQVPVLRYLSQDFRINRSFFPERNATISALTEASIIVEAGETSGTLTQARAAIAQGRLVFILDNCFRNKALKWPEKLEKKGAIRVKEFETILDHLKKNEKKARQD